MVRIEVLFDPTAGIARSHQVFITQGVREPVVAHVLAELPQQDRLVERNGS